MRPARLSPTLLSCLSGLLAMSLVTGKPAAAQAAALLPGRWEMRQISFIATQAVPPAVLERMDDPEVAELNQELRAGAAHLQVEFRADGTYQFTIARAGQPARLETGTYQLTATTLRAQSPGTAGGSSFDDQRVTQLTRRRLLIEFLVGENLPGILEEVEYRRIQ